MSKGISLLSVRHALAALVGCVVVFFLLVLSLLPMYGRLHGSAWLQLIAVFLPFAPLTTPLLLFLRHRNFQGLWPYSASAALVAAFIATVLLIQQPQRGYGSMALESRFGALLGGAVLWGLVGSTAGLFFWATTRVTSKQSSSANTGNATSGHGSARWLRGLVVALYLVPLLLLLVIILYGAGHELFGWPRVFGWWPEIY